MGVRLDNKFSFVSPEGMVCLMLVNHQKLGSFTCNEPGG